MSLSLKQVLGIGFLVSMSIPIGLFFLCFWVYHYYPPTLSYWWNMPSTIILWISTCLSFSLPVLSSKVIWKAMCMDEDEAKDFESDVFDSSDADAARATETISRDSHDV